MAPLEFLGEVHGYKYDESADDGSWLSPLCLYFVLSVDPSGRFETRKAFTQEIDKNYNIDISCKPLRAARSLLGRGPNPNTEGFKYNPALQAAAGRESVERCKYFWVEVLRLMPKEVTMVPSALTGATRYGNLVIVNWFINAK
ncbi:hypothetical protein N7537_010504 [Penicillium hordei]|uniref:Uncharacterized protein n=1 Tax=Penicillium hordei TaxID=40994 RepID=A0AAD6DUR7_9EURO|nr:uncharacterized protein N7537_010504 [Penicillium hordei]KAJ5593600.1 hypothetical protein N7537_010504 [Penicillium hordei]